MRILITGSREWTNWELLHYVLEEITRGIPASEITLRHGGARGADTLAGDFARAAGWTEEVYLPEWNRYGRAAGMIRNKKMTDAGADICVAFFITNLACAGTSGCVALAEKAGIPVRKVTR